MALWKGTLSLRWRLLAGFLLAASMTILSGVSGIISLQQIRQNMSDTARQVSENVRGQTVQTDSAIQLRDVIDKIDIAAATSDLDPIEQGLMGRDAERGRIQQRLKELISSRRQQILSSKTLKEVDQDVAVKLDQANRTISDIVDNVTVEVLMEIGDVVAKAQAGAQGKDPNGQTESKDISSFVDKALTKIKSALTARASTLELNLILKTALLSEDPNIIETYRKTADGLYRTIGIQLEPLAQEQGSQSVKDLLADLQKVTPRFMDAKVGQVRSSREFHAISHEVVEEARSRNLVVVASARTLEAKVNREFVGSSGFARKSTVVLIVISLVAFGMSVAIGVHMARSMAAPINALVYRVKEVADGDLTRSIVATRGDEIGLLASHFNGMVTSLKDILGRVQGVALKITTAGQEIHTISEAQAAGASDQSAAVSETTCAAAELSKNSEQIGENIKTISQMAGHVLAGMDKIKQATDQTSQILTSLNEKSKQIGAITELIDDVADQTNLLAVNASIEAARAGEQGRGFTVVADQIGKLADSTAKSTKGITSLVEVIRHEMSNAIIAMEQSLSGVEEEIQLAKESAAKSKEIAMSANQQISGSRQIAEAMASIDQTMKQIASGAQRSADAAGQLTALADELKASMARFKVTEHV